MTPKEMLGKTVMYRAGLQTFTTSTVSRVIETNRSVLIDLADGTTLRERDVYVVIETIL